MKQPTVPPRRNKNPRMTEAGFSIVRLSVTGG
jgi:hypothetical protein